jgi:hypothetical protein
MLCTCPTSRAHKNDIPLSKKKCKKTSKILSNLSGICMGKAWVGALTLASEAFPPCSWQQKKRKRKRNVVVLHWRELEHVGPTMFKRQCDKKMFGTWGGGDGRTLRGSPLAPPNANRGGPGRRRLSDTPPSDNRRRPGPPPVGVGGSQWRYPISKAYANHTTHYSPRFLTMLSSLQCVKISSDSLCLSIDK